MHAGILFSALGPLTEARRTGQRSLATQIVFRQVRPSLVLGLPDMWFLFQLGVMRTESYVSLTNVCCVRVGHRLSFCEVDARAGLSAMGPTL